MKVTNFTASVVLPDLYINTDHAHVVEARNVVDEDQPASIGTTRVAVFLNTLFAYLTRRTETTSAANAQRTPVRVCSDLGALAAAVFWHHICP